MRKRVFDIHAAVLPLIPTGRASPNNVCGTVREEGTSPTTTQQDTAHATWPCVYHGTYLSRVQYSKQLHLTSVGPASPVRWPTRAAPTCSLSTTLSASCSTAGDGNLCCCAPTASCSWASVGAPPREQPGSPSAAPPPVRAEQRTAGSQACRRAVRAVGAAGAAARGHRGSSGGRCGGMTHWREGTPPIPAPGHLATV